MLKSDLTIGKITRFSNHWSAVSGNRVNQASLSPDRTQLLSAGTQNTINIRAGAQNRTLSNGIVIDGE